MSKPKTKTERQALRDGHKDSWIPVESGDTIMGTVVDVVDAWSDQRRDPQTNRPGSAYPLLTIEAEEATGYDNLPRELKVHAFGAILFAEVMRKQPAVGEKVRIGYQGVGTPKPGQNAPELYSVRSAGGEGAKRAYASIDGRLPGRTATARTEDQQQRGGPAPAQPSLGGYDDDDIPF